MKFINKAISFKSQIEALRGLAKEYRDPKTDLERKSYIAELLTSFGAHNLNTGNGIFVIAI